MAPCSAEPKPPDDPDHRSWAYAPREPVRGGWFDGDGPLWWTVAGTCGAIGAGVLLIWWLGEMALVAILAIVLLLALAAFLGDWL